MSARQPRRSEPRSKPSRLARSVKRAPTEAPRQSLRVAIGADHGGFELKGKLIAYLQQLGYEVGDLGTHSPEPCDYPIIAWKVAAAVAAKQFDRGVLLCKSGIGIAIAANKVPGIRAGVCNDESDAAKSRQHNDANVLVIGAEKISEAKAKTIVKIWFATPFEGGRHERRVQQIEEIEQAILKQCGGTRSKHVATS